MADEQNPKDREEQVQGDETERDRSQQGASKGRSNEEQTDTLEDRNLSGSSTWANLPDKQTGSAPDSQSSDEDDSVSNR